MSMPESVAPWPHAPTHRLSENGTYFVTAGTYLKAHHFRTAQRLDVLQRGLLTVASKFGWELEAWGVFSNHTRTAGWINRVDNMPDRKVWHNFWDTKLTYEKSYLTRLNYVHQNAVKHGLVPVANQYPWCSARWFEGVASPAMVQSIYRFKIDAVRVKDDFAPIVE